MMNRIILVLLVWAAVVGAADFRDNNWGDTVEEVEAVEGTCQGGETGGGHRYLAYEVTLGTYDGVMVGFVFTWDGKLAVGTYYPAEAGVDVFWDWDELLTREYGEPDNADTFFTDDEYVLERYYYGGRDRDLETGIVSGYFSLARRGETDTTIILLVIGEIDRKAHTFLFYSSKEYYREFRSEEGEVIDGGF